MAKAYCQCINPRGHRALWNPILNEWVDISICGDCSKPSEGIWRNFLANCENCFKVFSFPETVYSPWGPYSVLSDTDPDSHDGLYVCKQCASVVGLQPPYRGWRWAAKQHPDWHPGYVDRVTDRSLPEILGSPEKPLDNLILTL